MAYILFETGSAKWIQAGNDPKRGTHQLAQSEPRFVSNPRKATVFNDIWTLPRAVENVNAQLYERTIERHDLNGRPVE